jgi:hypothetical protein
MQKKFLVPGSAFRAGLIYVMIICAIIFTIAGLLSRVHPYLQLSCFGAWGVAQYNKLLGLPLTVFEKSSSAAVSNNVITSQIWGLLAQSAAFAIFVCMNAFAVERNRGALLPILNKLGFRLETSNNLPAEMKSRGYQAVFLLVVTAYFSIFFMGTLLSDGDNRWLVVYPIVTAWVSYLANSRELGDAKSSELVLLALIMNAVLFSPFALALVLIALAVFASAIGILIIWPIAELDEFLWIIPSYTLHKWQMAFWSFLWDSFSALWYPLFPYLGLLMCYCALFLSFGVGLAFGHYLFLARAILCLSAVLGIIFLGYLYPCPY